MQLGLSVQILFVFVAFQTKYLRQSTAYSYDDYFDLESEMRDADSLNANQVNSNKLLLNELLAHAEDMRRAESPSITASETTECVTVAPTSTPPAPDSGEATASREQQASPTHQPVQPTGNREEESDKARQLKMLVQLLYIAQARVQLEAAEIKKAQSVANLAQKSLEEATNQVRTMSASLQNFQQEVAAAAIRAQTAQLKLAAHDQLLFAARQDVDALSTQLVSLQAAEGMVEPQTVVDLAHLLETLKQPLPESEKPTPVPALVEISTATPNRQQSSNLNRYNAPQRRQQFYYT